jgi:hypothetical protein
MSPVRRLLDLAEAAVAVAAVDAHEEGAVGGEEELHQ